MSTTPRAMADASAIYKSTRAQVEFFDNSLSQRVIWLSIGQSFFFGVYATLISIKAPDPDLQRMQHLVAMILPIAAVLNAVVTFLDVISSLNYMQKLRHRYEDITQNITSDQLYPFIWGKRKDRILQHASPVVIPVIFILSWIMVLIYLYQ